MSEVWDDNWVFADKTGVFKDLSKFWDGASCLKVYMIYVLQGAKYTFEGLKHRKKRQTLHDVNVNVSVNIFESYSPQSQLLSDNSLISCISWRISLLVYFSYEFGSNRSWLIR